MPKSLLTLLFILLAILAGVWFCNRQPDHIPDVTKKVTALIASEPKARAAYKQANANRQRDIKASAASVATGKGKAAQIRLKAQHSYANYVQQPTTTNGSIALTDCQQENAAHLEVIGLLTNQVTALEQDTAAKALEIKRSYQAFDSLAVAATGLVQENTGLRKKVARKNTLLKIGTVVIAVLAGMAAVK